LSRLLDTAISFFPGLNDGLAKETKTESQLSAFKAPLSLLAAMPAPPTLAVEK
jgi:hypothetical protein